MEAVLERPATDTTKLPMWVVYLLKDEGTPGDFIREGIYKVFPYYSKESIDKIIKEAEVNQIGLIWRGVRELAEHYYEQLKGQNLKVKVESEAV